jgi:RNA recognition motif-containing protein
LWSFLTLTFLKEFFVSKKLFVGNVKFEATEQDLKELFSGFGPVEQVKVIMDRETGRSRGFAFVTMTNVDDANKATAALDGKEVGGRKLVVNEARERAPRAGDRGEFRSRDNYQR